MMHLYQMTIGNGFNERATSGNASILALSCDGCPKLNWKEQKSQIMVNLNSFRGNDVNSKQAGVVQ